MSVKTTKELVKALELNREQIKGLPQKKETLPKMTAAERQNIMAEESKTRFMDYYSDVVFSIMNVIEKNSDRISTKATYGKDYLAIKTSSNDFASYLFEEFQLFKHDFIKKLNAIADEAPSIWIIKTDENGKQSAVSTYPILVKRKLEVNSRYDGLNNNRGIIADLEIDFNKDLFIGNNTQGLSRNFYLLPDNLPTLVKDYVKNNDFCILNSNGDEIKLQEKQLFNFIIFLRNHFNNYDYLQFPADISKVVNPRLLNTKGYVNNTENFYLYLLLYIYSYNDLFIQNKLDGFNFILDVPSWETTDAGEKIRIPTYIEESLQPTKIETKKEYSGNKTKITKTIIEEKKGSTKEELIKKAKEINEEITFTINHYTNVYAIIKICGYKDENGVTYPTFKQAKITFYEYLQDVENIPITKIFNILQDKIISEEKRKAYIKYIEEKQLYRTIDGEPISDEDGRGSLIFGKIIQDNMYLRCGTLLKNDFEIKEQ